MTKISRLPDGSGSIASDDLIPFVDVSTGANKCVLVGAIAGASLGWIDVTNSSYGATGDGVTDDSTAVGLAVAALLAQGSGTLYFPRGTYLINPGTLIFSSGGNYTITGDGYGSSVLTANSVSANPFLSVTTQGNNILIAGLKLVGNGLTGASGHGNGIASINTASGAGSSNLQPQHLVIRDCWIQGFRGNALDESGATITACGFFAFGSNNHVMDGLTFIYQCGMGLRFKTMFKHYLYGVVIDSCDANAIYLDDVENVAGFGCVLNGSGSAGATDGLLHARNCDGVAFYGSRFKNGNPYLVNLDGSTFTNRGVRLHGCSLQQLDSTTGHTAVRVGTGQDGVTVEGCDFIWVNTITDAVGVDAVQGAAGHNLAGLVVRGNTFNVGDGGTITAMVRMNIATNRCVAPIIEGNVFGNQDAASSATTYTSGVEIGANVVDAVIRNNGFVVATNRTMTNAILFSAGSSTGTQLLQNYYSAIAGTITNQVNNTGGAVYVRWEGATFMSGSTVRLANSINLTGRNNADTGNVSLVGVTTGDNVTLGGTNTVAVILQPNGGASGDAVILDSTALYPNSDTNVDLGKTAQRFGALFLSSDAKMRRLLGNGTAHVAGDYALSAGWGASGAVTVTGARDTGGRISVACAGAGVAANPTVALTFKDGTWGTAPAVVISRGDSAAPTTGFWALTSISATVATWTFIGLPVAGSSYVFDFVAIGK